MFFIDSQRMSFDYKTEMLTKQQLKQSKRLS